MKLNIILILSIATSVSAQGKKFCDGGTSGDGGCEKNGLATFCCMLDDKTPGYTTPRTTTVTSKGPGGVYCGPNKKGRVSCA